MNKTFKNSLIKKYGSVRPGLVLVICDYVDIFFGVEPTYTKYVIVTLSRSTTILVDSFGLFLQENTQDLNKKIKSGEYKISKEKDFHKQLKEYVYDASKN